MLFTYLKTSYRALNRDKKHFLLNLFGFSVGLAAALIVALFVTYELSYDNQHPNADRTYRVHTDYSSWGLQKIAPSGTEIPKSLLNRVDVEDLFVLREAEQLAEMGAPMILDVNIDGEPMRLQNTFVVSPNILDFVGIEVLAGDIRNTLSTPNALAISQREALRLFGTETAVGKTLEFSDGRYSIGAVFANLPENMHFTFDILAMLPPALENIHGYVYLRLSENADIAQLNEEMTRLFRERFSSQGRETLSLSLHRLSNIHFESSGPFEMKQGGSWLVLQCCIALTVLLLFIATVNFINLNIAAAAKRAKEVGVRKALGASKTQLICQFITESLMVVTIAAVIAFSFAELSIPSVNLLLGKSLSLSFSVPLLLSACLIVFAIGIFAGLDPALFIASFNAKRVLSGDLQRGKTAILVRKLTLTIQSGLSVILMVAAIVVIQQINFINQLTVGYEKTHRVVIKDLPVEAIFKANEDGFIRELRRIDGVEQLTPTNTLLTKDMNTTLSLVWPNGEKVSGVQPMIGTGFNPVETLGLELVAGRDASPEYASDWLQVDSQGAQTFSVLITEQLAALAGYSDPSELLGKTLAVQNYDGQAKVIGIIKDIKLGSAYQEQLPTSVAIGKWGYVSTGNLVLKLSPDADPSKIMDEANQIISAAMGVSNIELSTIEMDYYEVHKNENTIKKIIVIFSLLIIALTCLGILGLASFSVLKRQKEISMRKVLGASRRSIINVLASEFIKLVLIGVIIALPVCYWAIEQWLTHFNHRIEQSWWVYAASVLSIMIITWLTVASLSFKTASTRPAKILRYE